MKRRLVAVPCLAPSEPLALSPLPLHSWGTASLRVPGRLHTHTHTHTVMTAELKQCLIEPVA